MVLRVLAIGVYCLALLSGLLSFGAAPRDACYRLFLVMGIACLLAAFVYPAETLLRKRFLPLLIVGLVILVQIPFRTPVERYGYVFLALGWLALTFTVMVSQGRPGTRRTLFLFLVGLGLFDAFYGLAQALGGIDYIGDYERHMGTMATGTFVNRNHFAGLLNMTIPVALGGLYATFPRRGHKLRSEGYAWAWIIILVTAFMGLAILLSWSRGGAVSLVASLIFISFLMMMKRHRHESRKHLSAGAAWLLLVTTVGLGVWVGIDTLIERFGKVEESVDRLLVYRESVQLIAARPLGVGPKMYQYYFQPPVDVSQDCRWTHAHNDYLESAVEWGIPIAILFWGFVGWRLWRAGRVFLDTVPPSRDAWSDVRTGRDAPRPSAGETPALPGGLWREGIALGCAGAIFSILLHSFVDFNLQIPINWVVFCMILGLAWDGWMPPKGEARRWPRAAVAAGLCLLLLWPGWAVFKETVAMQLADADTVAGYQEALAWVPDHAVFHYGLGLIYRDDVDQQDLEKAGEHFTAAVTFNPREWIFWQGLAEYHELTGDYKKAEAALLTSLEIMPSYASARWRLGNSYLHQGRIEEALVQIRHAIDLNLAYREPSLMVFWKAGLTGKELDRVWPGDKDSQLMATRFLIAREAPAEKIGEQWQRAVAVAGDDGIKRDEGAFYLDYLSRRKALEALRQQWILTGRSSGIRDEDFENGTNLVWNGRFRLPLATGLLDWRMPASEAYEVQVAEDALKIDFKGTHNISFRAGQQVIIPRAGKYALSVKARSEEISTEQGPYFLVFDATTGKALGQIDQMKGSSGWTEHELTFEVPAGSQAVVVELRRNLSKRIDNKIRGTLWIGEVVLRPANGRS